MTVERSVIYVLEGYSLGANERGLIAAQHYAIEKSLPLAVVSIVPASELPDSPLETLSTIERLLKPYDVPLMVLVGERAEALKGVSRHLSPRIFPQDSTVSEHSIQRHPMAWPSRIQSVGEIFAFAAERPEMCLF